MPLNNSTKTRQRKPRYRRIRETGFRLQERDVEIIKLLFKNRFLTSEHIRALISGSSQGILRRLNLLFHNGYLDRPLVQVKPYQKGSEPMVYALGKKGAKLLVEKLNMPLGTLEWTSKNRSLKDKIFFEHSLMISHFMTCLDLACRNNDEVGIIEQEKILERAPVIKNIPVKWKVPLERGERNKKISAEPDKVFGLYFPKDPEGRNKAYFFLEADRSTMPIKRKNLVRTSYHKKMLWYHTSWKNEFFLNNLGFKAARVLTITKSQDRIKNMIEVCKEIDPRQKGLNMFLFAPFSAFNLSRPEKVLQKIWQTPKGERVSVVD